MKRGRAKPCFPPGLANSAGAATRGSFSSLFRLARHGPRRRGVRRGAGVSAGNKRCAPVGSCATKEERRPRSTKDGSAGPHAGRGDALFSPCVQPWASEERSGAGTFARYAPKMLSRGAGNVSLSRGVPGHRPAAAPQPPPTGMWTSPRGWRLPPGAAAAAASLDLSLLAPEKAVQVLFSGTAPGLRDPCPKMLSNAAEGQKAISYLLLGLFQGTPAWQGLASLPRLTKSKRRPRSVCLPGAGGNGLGQSGGAAAGLPFPLREEAVNWKGSRYPSCLNSAPSFPPRRVKKTERTGIEIGLP